MERALQPPENALVFALAGNPNVGKSTVFNGLTGMHQHTGNWSGKTVSNACGCCRHAGQDFVLVDLPGCYSLLAHSADEACARDFLCFGEADGVILVCDATCLERNLNLVLQTLEITPRVVLCVNLLDEAKRKGIRVDLEALSKRLGIPVVGTAARSGKGLDDILAAALRQHDTPPEPCAPVSYGGVIDAAIGALEDVVAPHCPGSLPPRWLALRLLEGDETMLNTLTQTLGKDLRTLPEVQPHYEKALHILRASGITEEGMADTVAARIVQTAEEIYRGAVGGLNAATHRRDRRLDAILTSKWTGFPIMFALLALIFWITIAGANYPSALLQKGLFALGEHARNGLIAIGAPLTLQEILIDGMYRVLAWVVSVMLPPMAIFFPLFTLLEDLGYLPRVAFNLDRCFQKCRACGKQALTMCMVGFYLQKGVDK